MSNQTMKGSAAVILLIICLLAVIGMLGYIFLVKPQPKTIGDSTADSAQISPTIPVKDYAPNMPASQKTTILIQTDDSSDEKYIVPTDQINVYVNSLPQGDHVISKTAL
jgi:hypothetical protein